jgi:hypothetical protein
MHEFFIYAALVRSTCAREHFYLTLRALRAFALLGLLIGGAGGSFVSFAGMSGRQLKMLISTRTCTEVLCFVGSRASLSSSLISIC